ncbi:reverse transcriptase domain-containing protein [Mesorhizobium sp. M0025]|uniref:reverse transcriptase domain-containing protein n=1 Tax=Mesorhizobium sp. M0025 TaxID=2956846 RepID=UPI00333AD92D
MPVRFYNFDYSYLRGGKPVFVPSARGRETGYDIKDRVEAAFEFDPFVHHLLPGGHVAALHAHRDRTLFARVDIETFFYGIGRNRVIRALRGIGVERENHYARWSTVKNPYDVPNYALPYGFVQSPILASLVLMTSPVGDYLRGLPNHITKSVYMDDIALSGDDLGAPAMDVFNCDLSFGEAVVREDRKAEFYKVDRSAASSSAFDRYCATVEQGNNLEES